MGEARLDSPGLVVRLTSVERTTPGILTVSFAVSNPDPAAPVLLGATFAASPADAGSMADVFLFDDAGQKKYFVLRGADGRGACSPDAGAIPAGQERHVWCRFPGPPAGVSRISVGVPRLPVFRDVPIAPPAAGPGDR